MVRRSSRQKNRSPEESLQSRRLPPRGNLTPFECPSGQPEELEVSKEKTMQHTDQHLAIGVIHCLVLHAGIADVVMDGQTSLHLRRAGATRRNEAYQ